MSDACKESCSPSVPSFNHDYKLDGIEGVPKYLKDYSTLATGGATGNLAVTFLGSYRAVVTVSNINCCEGKARVTVKVSNTSSAASGFRPPVLGYTNWWQQNVAPKINDFFSSGPMSPTKQTVELNTDIAFGADTCCCPPNNTPSKK